MMGSWTYQHADCIRRSQWLFDVLEDKFRHSQSISLFYMVQKTQGMVLTKECDMQGYLGKLEKHCIYLTKNPPGKYVISTCLQLRSTFDWVTGLLTL